MIKPAFSRSAPFPVLLLTLLLCTLAFKTSAQSPQEKLKPNLKPYIRQYSELAIRQMIEFHIPASVVLAQAIFESGSGTSNLALQSNNHFGIKCHDEWLGDTITMHDDTLNECFRKYFNVEESYRDHSRFLVMRPRYADLFLLPMDDYKSWCYGLKNAGYATYPTYAEDLIKLIEDEKLYELDNCPVLERAKPLAISNAPPAALKKSGFKQKRYTLKDFIQDGVLWLDEHDVLVQSLDMVVDTGDEAEASLVSGK